MKKVLTIVGPTAVGKTSLSIKLAKQFNGEIISGDSIQVYKGLDIGSGKIREEEKEGVKHYLINTLSNKDHYSVADFQISARNAIDEIYNNNHLPMIVGGTGLYVKACLYDYHFENDDQDNDSLVHELEALTNEELMKKLEAIDPESAVNIHINNRKRLIRALVISATQSKTKSDNLKEQAHTLVYDSLIIGCTMPRELLYERINMRVIQMIEDGLENEVASLIKNGVTFSDQSMQGIGYREWQQYFEGLIDKEEVIRRIQQDSRQFAKRQYTWFNNQLNVSWVDCSNDNCVEEASKLIKGWLENE